MVPFTLVDDETSAKLQYARIAASIAAANQRTPAERAEFSARIQAAIDAARGGPAPDRSETSDDDEPAAPVPARRKRKRSLTMEQREAKKAGLSVTGATYAVDGSVSFSFGEAVKTTNGDALDQWMARHANPTEGN
jgi:hypothetical protein